MQTEVLLSICAGIGLSAACGFRVFVPLLVMSIAAHSGHLTLGSGFEWIGSTPAVTSFAVASALELTAYYVPWLDNALDTVATPAAAVAGTVVTASMVTDMSPYLQWTMAAIAGGGAATLVKGTMVLVRGVSSATTAGFANPILSTVELGGSVFGSVMALLVPPLAILLMVVVLFFVSRKLLRMRAAKASVVTSQSSL